MASKSMLAQVVDKSARLRFRRTDTNLRLIVWKVDATWLFTCKAVIGVCVTAVRKFSTTRLLVAEIMLGCVRKAEELLITTAWESF